jgi:hypothetical protein
LLEFGESGDVDIGGDLTNFLGDDRLGVDLSVDEQLRAEDLSRCAPFADDW